VEGEALKAEQRTEGRTVDLGRLALSSGEATRLDVPLGADTLTLGGQEYAIHRGAEARLDVSRTTTGYALRLRYEVELRGPCMRCLTDARIPVSADAREVEQPGYGEDDLESPYIEAEELDVAGWAHDALALALPPKLLCRPDCAGLCPVCGESLNDRPHEH
jgi:uncharacterized protein